METLSRALERFARAASPVLNKNVSRLPGSGASGGLGAGLMVLGAQLRARGQAMDEYFGLDGLFSKPWDLVVTAEGSLDYQSSKGKMPVEIAKRAKSHGIPVMALAGTIGPGAESVYESGICSFVGVVDRPISLDEAIKDAKKLLEDGAERAMRTLQLGISLRCKQSPLRISEDITESLAKVQTLTI